jgi:hypothetical protein
MEPCKISYMWLIRNDLFLSLLILALFIIVCNYLVTFIVIKQGGVTFKPKLYMLDIFTHLRN